MPERRRAALEGLLAAGLGVALDWAISAPDPALPFAPVALADRGVRLTSGELETFAIERLGHAALPLLAVGATVGFLLLGAGLGLAIASRRARAPSAAGLAFAATLASAELAAPARPPVAAALASAAAGGALYSATLLGPPPPSARRLRPGPQAAARRAWCRHGFAAGRRHRARPPVRPVDARPGRRAAPAADAFPAAAPTHRRPRARGDAGQLSL